MRGVDDQLAEGPAARSPRGPSPRASRWEPAGRGLALADLVAVEDQDARRRSRPARGRRPGRRSSRRRRARRSSPPSGVRSSPRLVGASASLARVLEAGAGGSANADRRHVVCNTLRPCPTTDTTTEPDQRPSPRPSSRESAAKRRRELRRPPDRGRRQARPQLRRDDQALRGGRRRQRQGRADRQGRGPGRHRLQVRGRHPLQRALDPQARSIPPRRSSSASRSTPSSSPRRTRRGA